LDNKVSDIFTYFVYLLLFCSGYTNVVRSNRA